MVMLGAKTMNSTGALLPHTRYCFSKAIARKETYLKLRYQSCTTQGLQPHHKRGPPSSLLLSEFSGATELCCFLHSTFSEKAVSLAVVRETGAESHNSCGGLVVCLFGGFFKKNAAEKAKEPERKFHEVPVPFPVSLLARTFLAGKELGCCYKATADGFSAAQFHKSCDFKGPCVIIGRTVSGMRFGAFNPEGYRSTDDYYDSFDAFLFYWIEEGKDPIVLPKVGGSGAALFDYARGGPQFGADGLLIGPPLAPVMGGFAGPDTNSGGGELTEARSRLGLSYAKRVDGKDSLFGDSRNATLVEVEVFCSPAIARLY